jgi:AraC-like DNA-binding protein
MASPIGVFTGLGAFTAPGWGFKPDLELSGSRMAFRTCDFDRAVDWFERVDCGFHISRRDARQLDLSVSGFFLPQSYVGLTHYGARAAVQASTRHVDYWILIPVRGWLATSVRGQEFLCNPRRGFVFSYPSMGPSRIEVDAGGARLTVMLLRAGIEWQLAALLGRPPDTQFTPPVEFAPAIDLATGYGRNIARYAYVAHTDVARGGVTAHQAIAGSAFEQFIISELLLWHPHNYSQALHGPAPAILPRDVRRAIDYMQAHLHDPVTLSDIIAAAGVPGRTLLKHFEDHRGISPMRYWREARFDKVREALQRADAQVSVTEIATCLGFSHLGRFAVEYRRRFGERPSDTLRKRR